MTLNSNLQGWEQHLYFHADRGAWETQVRLLLSLAFCRFSLGGNATFSSAEALRDSPSNDCETECSTIRKGIERWRRLGLLVVSYPVCSSVRSFL